MDPLCLYLDAFAQMFSKYLQGMALLFCRLWSVLFKEVDITKGNKHLTFSPYGGNPDTRRIC